MSRRIGIHPVPDDADIEKFLQKLLDEAQKETNQELQEYFSVVEYGKTNGEPQLFAYARLLNHLAELKTPQLIRILSVYMYGSGAYHYEHC